VMRRAAFLLSAFAMMAALVGCGQSAERSITVVLLDPQAVAPSGQLTAGAQADYGRIVSAAVGTGGDLYVDVLDANPLSHATDPVQVHVGRYSEWTGNRTAHRAEVARALDLAERGASRLVADSTPGASLDIVGGIQVATRVLESYPSGHRYLVIMSSMLQQSSVVDFYVDDPSVWRTALLSAPASISKLEGTQVTIVGAGVAPPGRPELDATRATALEAFWTEYFRDAGSPLRSGSYGPVLLRFGANR